MNPTPEPVPNPAPVAGHRLYEDVQALITGTLFVALGVLMYRQAGLLTGGTAGLAFLTHYASGVDFGLAFFCINLPFYVFAWKRMGWQLTTAQVATWRFRQPPSGYALGAWQRTGPHPHF